MKEKEIQVSILEYLVLKKVFHWRQNSGAFKTAKGGFYRMGIIGAPDIFCLKDGKCYGLEVKVPKGKLNPNQIDFSIAFTRAGGYYEVVRSIDDVIALGL